MMGQRLGQRANITTILGQCSVFPGYIEDNLSGLVQSEAIFFSMHFKAMLKNASATPK